jgi:hypothetical protein
MHKRIGCSNIALVSAQKTLLTQTTILRRASAWLAMVHSRTLGLRLRAHWRLENSFLACSSTFFASLGEAHASVINFCAESHHEVFRTPKKRL